ncbi:MAG: hypothetical protein KAR65_04700, partial [Anaerolineales bacterium]|nr:hypothetical protein [Anaerolineales bacterium]
MAIRVVDRDSRLAPSGGVIVIDFTFQLLYPLIVGVGILCTGDMPQTRLLLKSSESRYSVIGHNLRSIINEMAILYPGIGSAWVRFDVLRY